MNKRKIINDPVYGFITIKSELLFDIVTHPWFQRLRHIKQLGLTDYVYPGAVHSRFQHALGAMHLMGRVLDNLKTKGVDISPEEYEACQVAILLHDIGHGPLSHTLEETLLIGIKHESLSFLFMKELNLIFEGSLDLAIRIFTNSYDRKFFFQMVSSQLDIDRLDYLKRDCFFTGVMEGTIGVDRIISMLNVHDDQLVVEEKGIYSIENFLNARRLMYWQVYLHKTTVSVERLMVNIIRRAQYLVDMGENLQTSVPLHFFLKNKVGLEDFNRTELLEAYGALGDHDIWGALTFWKNHPDKVLSTLTKMLLERRLFRIKLSSEPISKDQVEAIRQSLVEHYGVIRAEATFLFSYGVVSNEAYTDGQKINILTKDGQLLDIAQASDLPNIKAISKIVKKNYLCWPKNVYLPGY